MKTPCGFSRRLFCLTVVILAYFGAAPAQERARVSAAADRVVEGRFLPEPILWVGENSPPEAESQELLEILTHLDEPDWTTKLERFIEAHLDSPWVPGVRNALAVMYRQTGRYTRALQHWESAWEAAKANSSVNGRVVADATLVNWLGLLSSLGRVQTMKSLFTETEGRVFERSEQYRRYETAQSAYYIMLEHPQIAFRCGAFALKAVGQKLQPGNRQLETLVEASSPATGFTLTSLAEYGRQLGLGLAPVRRLRGSELLVPSVVHWRENHYAAILDHTNQFYLVSDPTFGSPAWLADEVVNSEASGVFLAPTNRLPSGWIALTKADTDLIYGKGYTNSIDDSKDKGCKKNPLCPGKCVSCSGMPVWWVSEPYINIWASDEPLSYKTSTGEEISFRLSYKQRDTRPTTSTSLPPTTWNHNWFSYVHFVGQNAYPGGQITYYTFYPYSASLYLPDGGVSAFDSANISDEASRTTLLSQQGTGVAPYGPLGRQNLEDGFSGFRLIHPDGSQDIYGLIEGVRLIVGFQPYGDALLTEQIDPLGNRKHFYYEGGLPATLRLKYVVDYDGRTNTLTYNSSNWVSQVQSPYGNSASFLYDSKGNLTNIVDAAGLSTTNQFDANGYLTSMITPYGTISFVHTVNNANTNTLGNMGGHDINRAIKNIQPDGSKQLYLYRFDCSSFMPTTYSNIPAGTPLGTIDDGTGATNIFAGVCYRDSFYWGSRQYAALSTEVLTNLTANDYLLAQMKHWLQDTNDAFVSDSISILRDPSPENSSPTEGQKTFYDYPGKVYSCRVGTTTLPSVTARVLPTGETQYTWTRYNSYGFPTNEVSTYTQSDGSAGTRTNQYLYADNVTTNILTDWSGAPFNTNKFTLPNLLQQQIGPDNLTLAQYEGYDQVQRTAVYSDTSFAFTNTVTTYTTRVLPRYQTNAVGELTQFTYDSQSKITSAKTPAGLITTNLYLASGAYTNFLDQSIDFSVSGTNTTYYRTNSYTYTSSGLVSTQTDPHGLTVTRTWDNLLRPTGVSFPDGTFTSNRWDKLGLVATQDRLTNWTYYGYDSLRHLTAITNAANQKTYLTWCGCGSLESIANALGEVTSFAYDNQSRLKTLTFTNSLYLNYSYDLAGRLTNAVDSYGASLSYSYNNQGLRTGASNALGQVWKTVYDIKDRPSQVTDNNGVSVTNTFDLLNRLLTRTYPDSGVERFGYTANILTLTGYTNQLGSNVVNLFYDAAGRLTNEVYPTVFTNSFTYNGGDDLLTLKDGKSQTATWKYDQYGRLTNKVDAANITNFVYKYDANDRLTNRTDALTRQTAYQYDDAGNITNLIYPTLTIQYAYDALNRPTNMVDAAGVTRFAYSRLGALALEDGPWASDTVTSTYGTGHLLTALTLQQPNAADWTQTYGYDSARRLTNLVSQAGTFGYGYTSSVGATPALTALIQKLALPNGSYITNAFDSVGRMTSTFLVNSGNANLNYHTYNYDLAGQRTRQYRMGGGPLLIFADYTYDLTGQLKTAKGKEGLGGTFPDRVHEQFGYAYDGAGNLYQRTNNALVQTFGVNNLNQLTNVTRSGTLTVAGTTTSTATNVTVNSLTATRYTDNTFAKDGFTLADGNNSFTAIAQDSYNRKDTNAVTLNLPAAVNFQYDAKGNLTSDGKRGLDYDDENQLNRITVTNSWKSEFTYDGLFRRRIRKEYVWSGSWLPASETRYVYDGRVVLQERDENNLPSVTYTRGLDLSGSSQGAGGIGGLLARTDASGSAFYHADGNGNVTALLNGQQNFVARYVYDPFGNILAKSGALADANAYRFSSQEYHQPSGLLLYLYRAYDPNLQRFVNRDPIEEVGGINLYRFVFNNPLNRLDPWGLDAYVEIITDGGPIKGTDHANIYVDNPDGTVSIGQAAYGSVYPYRKFPSPPKPDKTTQVFRLKCDALTDRIMVDFMKSGKSGQIYPYCAPYAAEVLSKGFPNYFNQRDVWTASGLSSQINNYRRGRGFSPEYTGIRVNAPPAVVIIKYR